MKRYMFFVFILVLIIFCGGKYTRNNTELKNNAELKNDSALVGTWCAVHVQGAWMEFGVSGGYIMSFNGIEYNGEWHNYKTDSLYFCVKINNGGNIILETYKCTYDFIDDINLVIHATLIEDDKIKATYDMVVYKCKKK